MCEVETSLSRVNYRRRLLETLATSQSEASGNASQSAIIIVGVPSKEAGDEEVRTTHIRSLLAMLSPSEHVSLIRSMGAITRTEPE